VFWADKHSEKLGGPGRTVKIDEAKLADGNTIVDGSSKVNGSLKDMSETQRKFLSFQLRIEQKKYSWHASRNGSCQKV